MKKPLTAEEFAQRVVRVQLLTQTQVQKIWAEFGTREVQLEQFQQLLLGRDLLTNFQVDKLMRGQKSGYYYGDYRVLYLVGAGTFARVFRAVHKGTGEVVAVKLLRQRHCKDLRLVEQFCREGEMGRSLRHPNIVPIYEVGSHENHHYLVLEFIEGRNLRDFLKVRKTFDPLQAT
ncbi:MAG: protein kinase [Planctomycetes bacterium]|nr:protein kinase [Planctomycetota bacterium]